MTTMNPSRVHAHPTPIALLILCGCLVACGNVVEAGTDDVLGTDAAIAFDSTTSGCASGCPDPLFCAKGACIAACQNSDECNPGETCDTQGDGKCHTPSTSQCPCQSPLVCFNGSCVQPTQLTQCQIFEVLSGTDPCDAASWCVEYPLGTVGRCQPMDSCGVASRCDTGVIGAWCNDGTFPGKERKCMRGLCAGFEDCPLTWNCVMLTSMTGIGMCSSGEPASLCANDYDCKSAHCNLGEPGYPGQCE